MEKRIVNIPAPISKSEGAKKKPSDFKSLSLDKKMEAISRRTDEIRSAYALRQDIKEKLLSILGDIHHEK